MPATLLTPDQLDQQAAALYDTAAWQQIVSGWALTAPEPTPRTTVQTSEQTTAGDWRNLLHGTVDDLIATATTTLPPAAPAERPLPGRLGAILPDRLHAWRRIGQPDIRPSVQLAYARRILVEWGWQNRPYRLRDGWGARCLCGALLSAHRLGYGSLDTANRSAAWLMTGLRHEGWAGLIGEWNRAPGRTAGQALDLVDTVTARAAQAGE